MARFGFVLALFATGCVFNTEPDFGNWPLGSVEVNGDISVNGRTALVQDTVRVSLVLHNRGSTQGEVRFGACSFLVRALGSRGSGWDNRPPANANCPSIELVLQLTHGESRELVVMTNAASQLRTELSPGPHAFLIYFRRAGELESVSAGSLTF